MYIFLLNGRKFLPPYFEKIDFFKREKREKEETKKQITAPTTTTHAHSLFYKE